MEGKNILLYSYGSGLASSMYRMKCHSKLRSLSPVMSQVDLSAVETKTPMEFFNICAQFSEALGKKNYIPTCVGKEKGVFFLEKIDKHGLRHYKRVE